MDKAEYRAQKIGYYDRKDDLLQTLTFPDYNRYLDEYWRAAALFMKNHQPGKSTRMKQTNFRFRTGLSDRDFDRISLQHIRQDT